MPEVKIEYHGNPYKEYVGRLLGLITTKELCALSSDIKLRKQLLTAATVTIKDLNEVGTNAADMRVVMSIREINGEYTARKLLITAPIDMIATYNHSAKELGVVCINDNWFVIKEIEKG